MGLTCLSQLPHLTPLPTTHFHLSLTLFDRLLTSPYFSFLSFSSFAFSVEHSSSLLQTLPLVPPCHHLHHHFPGNVTGKSLGTSKHLHLLFEVLANLLGTWRIRLLRLRVFVTMESDLGQYSFTLDDAFFPAAYGRKRFLDCVWVRLLLMGPRDHMQEMFYLTCSLYCP
ncbi:uncharacterized protein LOC126696049 [Quercus robur]|uniref:uncharacterized protein LOC126696049 n=1 Tax=Quercus robur TaxID=38942 RepID=UPI0021634437|nr:uncharacterized protein LOC126696049 [Quercus robur]